MTTGLVNLFDYEALAKESLPSPEYDFIAGGAADEISIRRARVAFDSIMLRPRVLVDIGQRDMSTSVLSHQIKLPILLAPSGNHNRAHPDGELATVRAAGAMGTLMVLSSRSSHRFEDVASAATGPIWFQQYIYRDREMTRMLAQRAEDAGYSAICLTLDSSLPGRRERDIRNRYVLPPSANYPDLQLLGTSFSAEKVPGLFDLIDPSATWVDLEWMASHTSLSVLAKGIMTGEDARLSIEHGARALIVSNHGGRQLDTTFAPIEVLPEVIAAVGGRAEVYLDGGIRRGTDVLKALALGARAVLIGRPLFWGLAVDGESGVRTVLQTLRDELDSAMGMSGRPTIDSIDSTLVATVSPLVSAFQQAENPH